jgi:hypothetical protein
MKLPRFSLATLLICITVLAVVCAAAIEIPVRQIVLIDFLGAGGVGRAEHVRYEPPTASEFALRLAWAGPLSIAAALAALRMIRRLRQPNRPPV